MSLPIVTPLDWRDQLTQLQPYFDGRGGVVHVEYAGVECAPEAFVATISHLYENRHTTNLVWRSARIDRDVWNTRYLGGVLRLLERKLGLRPSVTEGVAGPLGRTQFASGNVADGNMSIDIDVHKMEVVSGDEYAYTLRKEEGIDRVLVAMQRHLEGGRFLLVLMEHAAGEASDFWRDCWAGRLQGHLERGLALVKMVNTGERTHARHPDEPAPNCVVRLPERLEGRDRSNAEDDLALHLENHFGMSSRESIAAAASFLAGKDSVARIHNELTYLMMDLGKSMASHA